MIIALHAVITISLARLSFSNNSSGLLAGTTSLFEIFPNYAAVKSKLLKNVLKVPLFIKLCGKIHVLHFKKNLRWPVAEKIRKETCTNNWSKNLANLKISV